MSRRGGHDRRFGGSAPPAAWTPLLLSPVMWLRADLGVTLNGSNVSAWADQSGAGNSFTQGTGANQPPLVTSLAALNNQAAIGPFRNTAQTLNYAGSNTYAGPWTMGIVYYRVSASPGGEYLFGNQTSNRGDIYCDGGAQNALTHQATATLTGDITSSFGSHCMFVDEIAAGSKLFIDSSTAYATGSAGTNSTLFAGGTACIGSYNDDRVSGLYNYNGYIAEMFLFDRTLSTADKDAILAYSRARYGTP